MHVPNSNKYLPIVERRSTHWCMRTAASSVLCHGTWRALIRSQCFYHALCNIVNLHTLSLHSPNLLAHPCLNSKPAIIRAFCVRGEQTSNTVSVWPLSAAGVAMRQTCTLLAKNGECRTFQPMFQ